MALISGLYLENILSYSSFKYENLYFSQILDMVCLFFVTKVENICCFSSGENVPIEEV